MRTLLIFLYLLTQISYAQDKGDGEISVFQWDQGEIAKFKNYEDQIPGFQKFENDTDALEKVAESFKGVYNSFSEKVSGKKYKDLNLLFDKKSKNIFMLGKRSFIKIHSSKQKNYDENAKIDFNGTGLSFGHLLGKSEKNGMCNHTSVEVSFRIDKSNNSCNLLGVSLLRESFAKEKNSVEGNGTMMLPSLVMTYINFQFQPPDFFNSGLMPIAEWFTKIIAPKMINDKEIEVLNKDLVIKDDERRKYYQTMNIIRTSLENERLKNVFTDMKEDHGNLDENCITDNIMTFLTNQLDEERLEAVFKEMGLSSIYFLFDESL